MIICYFLFLDVTTPRYNVFPTNLILQPLSSYKFKIFLTSITSCTLTFHLITKVSIGLWADASLNRHMRARMKRIMNCGSLRRVGGRTPRSVSTCELKHDARRQVFMHPLCDEQKVKCRHSSSTLRLVVSCNTRWNIAEHHGNAVIMRYVCFHLVCGENVVWLLLLQN